MVPEVDKFDTEQALRAQRDTLEAARQEILDIVLDYDQTTDDQEAHAVKKLASRSAQSARQFTGRMLGELGGSYPYPNSHQAGNTKIDPTTVAANETFTANAELHPIQRIKLLRNAFNTIDKNLEALVASCIPGTRFNIFLFEVQKQVIQASMWLGEVLHFCVEPKIEVITAEKEGKVVAAIAPTDSGSVVLPLPAVAPELTGFAAAEAHDILALGALGTRVLVNNFVPGESLAGLIVVNPDRVAPGNYDVQLDKPTAEGVSTIALRPTAVDAIQEYQIVSEPIQPQAEVAGEVSASLSPDNDSLSTEPNTNGSETGSGDLGETPSEAATDEPATKKHKKNVPK